MTNLERWQLIMKDVPSPQSYIDFGYYFLISASLQRRVWVAGKRNIYPNQYCFLVGEPGLGKNWVTEPVEEMLKFHKREKQQKREYKHLSPEVQEAIREAEKAALEQEEADDKYAKKKRYEDQLLIPVGADATTYEALTRMTADSIRRMNYSEFDDKLQKDVIKFYTHSSVVFCLKELSSLFQEHKTSLVNFLITAYDCGDYSYVTKGKGEDHIQKSCVNILGGTTPGFLRKTFSDSLLTEGFASRSWFIYEAENRFERLRVPELNPEQLACDFHLRNHVKKLTELFGKIVISEEVWDFAENWWKTNQQSKVNKSPKLQSYYARKNIHVIKLALALHFSDNYTLDITVDEVKRAIEILNTVEVKMHNALEFDGRNPLSKVAKKVVEFLKKNGPRTTEELIAVFYEDCSILQLKDVLQFLLTTKKIENVPDFLMPNGKKRPVWIYIDKAASLEFTI